MQEFSLKGKVNRRSHEVKKMLVKRIKPMSGIYEIPCDRQILQRAIFILSQAVGKSVICNYTSCEDSTHLIDCLRNLGVRIKRDSHGVTIYGVGLRGLKRPKNILNTGCSRIVASMLMGAVATYSFTSIFTCDEKVIGRFENSSSKYLTYIGAELLSNKFSTTVKGTDLSIPEVHKLEQSSSYIKSALIIAGLNTVGRTTVIEPFSGSLDHTELMLKHLIPDNIIIKSSKEEKKVIVNGVPEIRPINDFKIPGDPSVAVFLVAAAILLQNSEIEINDLCLNPARMKIYTILQSMGADITIESNETRIGEMVGSIFVRSSALTGINIKENSISMEDFPILLVLASYAEGCTVISSHKPLKILKNAKIFNIISYLKSMGVNITHDESSLTINGGLVDGGIEVDVRNDYNTALSFIVCSFAAKRPITIYNHQNYWFNLFYNSDPI